MFIVLAVGAFARVVLTPITYGQDFIVWNLVARALLNGSNFYAHRPAHLPGGPYGYLPLFAYIEMPFRLLADYLPVSFVVLGKIPVLAGDALVAWCIVRWCRRADVSETATVLAVALWWLNPLVLYNGAWYGRFDSLCVGFLLVGLLAGPPIVKADGHRAKKGPAFFGLAIAMKTFPAFLLPWFLRNGRERGRMFWYSAVTAFVVSLPLILLSPGEVIKSVLLY